MPLKKVCKIWQLHKSVQLNNHIQQPHSMLISLTWQWQCKERNGTTQTQRLPQVNATTLTFVCVCVCLCVYGCVCIGITHLQAATLPFALRKSGQCKRMLNCFLISPVTPTSIARRRQWSHIIVFPINLLCRLDLGICIYLLPIPCYNSYLSWTAVFVVAGNKLVLFIVVVGEKFIAWVYNAAERRLSIRRPVAMIG